MINIERFVHLRIHENARLITLVRELQKYPSYNPESPVSWDSLIAFKKVLNLLDEHRLPYSKRECQTTFNKMWDYSNPQSEDKQAYFSWISQNAISRVLNYSQVRKKRAISRIYSTQMPPQSHKMVAGMETPTNYLEVRK